MYRCTSDLQQSHVKLKFYVLLVASLVYFTTVFEVEGSFSDERWNREIAGDCWTKSHLGKGGDRRVSHLLAIAHKGQRGFCTPTNFADVICEQPLTKANLGQVVERLMYCLTGRLRVTCDDVAR